MAGPFVNTSIVLEESDWNMDFHTHPESVEISVLLEGSGEFECLGKTYRIESGHVIIIPVNLPHAYRARTPVRFAVIEAGGLHTDTCDLFHVMWAGNTPSIFFLTPLSLEMYAGLFRFWIRTVSGVLQDRSRNIKAWLEVMILFLREHGKDANNSITLVATADYIRGNLYKEISVAALAKQCGLSESAFRSQFKKTFGSSPKQFHQTCRIEEAKWLLRATDRPIQSIAEDIGFVALHSFSAWFQKNEGIPPSEWRKRQHGQGSCSAKRSE